MISTKEARKQYMSMFKTSFALKNVPLLTEYALKVTNMSIWLYYMHLDINMNKVTL